MVFRAIIELRGCASGKHKTRTSQQTQKKEIAMFVYALLLGIVGSIVVLWDAAADKEIAQ